MQHTSLLDHLCSLGILYFNKDTSEYCLTAKFAVESLPPALGFSNVAIKQNKNKCSSRLDANTHSEFVRGETLAVPIIAANMSSVINSRFCILLQKLGALGILHRALSEEKYIEEVSAVAAECKLVPVSVGVGKSQLELAAKLVSAGANLITIDIAHGYCDAVIELGKEIKKRFPSVKLIVGNTINSDMLDEVNDFADAVKVGIATGSACKTKNTAGCFLPQFSALLSFKERAAELGMPIISDGAIREPADFVKAIAAGASSAMAGSIFAMCPESAAEYVTDQHGMGKKVYFGMASTEAQIRWRGGLKPGTCAEGGVRHLPMGQPASELIERYSGALRSGMTYAGAHDIKSFHQNVGFIRL